MTAELGTDTTPRSGASRHTVVLAADGTEVALPRTGLFIAGEWRPSSSGATMAVRDPATEEVIAEVADGEAEDGIAACVAASIAAASWAAKPPRERGELLRAAFDRMLEQAERLAYIMSLENGKTLSDSRGEVRYAAEFFRWFSEEAVRNRGWLGTSPSGSNRMVVLHQPIGVSVLVTPWNFPAAMATRKIGPALAAGCTVVLKPASATPLTALALAEILTEVGVPGGVINVVPSSRSGRVVAAMLDQPEVRKLSFTGSTAVGKTLLAAASRRVISCSMELGGNAPFLVFADADMEQAVKGAMIAKMRNGGQACTAANRFYVEESVVDEFAEKLGAAMSRLAIGAGTASDTECAPLINAEARDKVIRLVDDAVARGARIVCGGRPIGGKGYFVEPTVLTGIRPGSLLLDDEIFGPVAPIISFRDPAEAIAAANATPYGLMAYVYTQDLARGLAVSEALEAGMIGLNRGLVSDPAAPFGGVKESGLGREGADVGMAEFLETKYIATGW
ncbi:MAG: NAD-dependent succinate-semialdehyde dehydrogenase [Candidatus Limnocylindrales bacterium]